MGEVLLQSLAIHNNVVQVHNDEFLHGKSHE